MKKKQLLLHDSHFTRDRKICDVCKARTGGYTVFRSIISSSSLIKINISKKFYYENEKKINIPLVLLLPK